MLKRTVLWRYIISEKHSNRRHPILARYIDVASGVIPGYPRMATSYAGHIGISFKTIHQVSYFKKHTVGDKRKSFHTLGG